MRINSGAADGSDATCKRPAAAQPGHSGGTSFTTDVANASPCPVRIDWQCKESEYESCSSEAGPGDGPPTWGWWWGGRRPVLRVYSCKCHGKHWACCRAGNAPSITYGNKTWTGTYQFFHCVFIFLEVIPLYVEISFHFVNKYKQSGQTVSGKNRKFSWLNQISRRASLSTGIFLCKGGLLEIFLHFVIYPSRDGSWNAGKIEVCVYKNMQIFLNPQDYRGVNAPLGSSLFIPTCQA